jgi:hypothetical protein
VDLSVLAVRLLGPLYLDPSLMGLRTPLNSRIDHDDLERDASEIRSMFLDMAETKSQSYQEVLIVEAVSPIDRAAVRAPYGCEEILNWTRQAFCWSDLRERAAQEKHKGTFWIEEMENVITEVMRGERPSVMTSTFRGRGRTAGRIYQPQLEKVDFVGDRPIRYYFGFHEVLVPELVRGPGAIGDVFNLLHIALRVRWEVLNPFLVTLGTPRARDEISEEERDAVIGMVSGSLRVIELEAERHGMFDDPAISSLDGGLREKVSQMLRERALIRDAISEAVAHKDFDELMKHLTRVLEQTTMASNLLAERFVELLRRDREKVLGLIERERS